MDIVGFAILGAATGLGGGTLRDVLLGAFPVVWVKEPAYLVLCFTVSSVVFYAARVPMVRRNWLEWLDAVGLALVAVLGAERGLAAGCGTVVAATMGVITAASGGVIRDILSGEVPFVLPEPICLNCV